MADWRASSIASARGMLLRDVVQEDVEQHGHARQERQFDDAPALGGGQVEPPVAFVLGGRRDRRRPARVKSFAALAAALCPPGQHEHRQVVPAQARRTRIGGATRRAC